MEHSFILVSHIKISLFAVFYPAQGLIDELNLRLLIMTLLRVRVMQETWQGFLIIFFFIFHLVSVFIQTGDCFLKMFDGLLPRQFQEKFH